MGAQESSHNSSHAYKEWAFWDVHNPEMSIIITLKDQSYQNLVIEVADTHASIAEINKALLIFAK